MTAHQGLVELLTALQEISVPLLHITFRDGFWETHQRSAFPHLHTPGPIPRTGQVYHSTGYSWVLLHVFLNVCLLSATQRAAMLLPSAVSSSAGPASSWFCWEKTSNSHFSEETPDVLDSAGVPALTSPAPGMSVDDGGIPMGGGGMCPGGGYP